MTNIDQQFAQVREALWAEDEVFDKAEAALSAIEQWATDVALHVQDMETALWHYAAEGNWLRDEDGNEVWDGNHDAAGIARAALPAREKGTE